MDTFSYYKDSYFYELQRKDQLNGSLSFPVGIVTLLGGLAAIIAKAVSWPPDYNERVLLIFLALSVLCLASACFYLVRSYWGHPYRYMPFSEDLLNFEATLKNYYNKTGKNEEDAKTLTTRELTAYVVSEYAANAKFNAQSNERKSAAIFKANAFVISAMIALACTAPSYLYEKSREKPEPLKIQLVNQGPAMTTNNDPPASKEPPPAPIEKPVPPPSREIKEHVEKPRK
jgi:hypothetical protein